MSGRGKKSGPSTIRTSRGHARALAPRAPVHERVEVRAYPSAAELFAQGTAWRDFVTDTLRSLLAPAAIASAFGLAGCAGGDSPNGVVGGDTTRTESAATLTPVGTPTLGTPTVDTTQPTGGGVVVTALPPTTLTPVAPGQLRSPPTRVTPTHGTPPHIGGAVRAIDPPPAILPAIEPPDIAGESPPVRQSAEPQQVQGQMRQVQPIQPTVNPQALGGAPPPIQSPPPPVQPTGRPQPPHPHPPAVPGGRGVRGADRPVRSN